VLIENFLQPGQDRRTRFVEGDDDFFQRFARHGIDLQLGFLSFAQEGRIFPVATNAERMSCTRSLGVPGGITKGRAISAAS
jgi:hypothetical protein